jgi:hypothetical protein
MRSSGRMRRRIQLSRVRRRVYTEESRGVSDLGTPIDGSSESTFVLFMFQFNANRHPASWRMPSRAEIERLQTRLEPQPAPDPAPDGETDPGWWDSVLADPGRAAAAGSRFRTVGFPRSRARCFGSNACGVSASSRSSVRTPSKLHGEHAASGCSMTAAGIAREVARKTAAGRISPVGRSPVPVRFRPAAGANERPRIDDLDRRRPHERRWPQTLHVAHVLDAVLGLAINVVQDAHVIRSRQLIDLGDKKTV